MAEAGEVASVAASGALPRDSQVGTGIDSSSERASESTRLQPPPPMNQTELFKAIEIVERDSVAIAESFTSLLISLRMALAEVSGSSVEHMQCFSDAAGRLQESALDASTMGNRYINSCLRLNEEMKGADNLAAQLKYLRKTVDTLDSAVNRLLRLP
uniref:BLOC-1-related complex subunit 6 C-terminal helix domain-containing protein n=1 Tax=Kalanchoe fedtschenkoi TaxID=63787 RepID=A0A7N0V499_KALFE